MESLLQQIASLPTSEQTGLGEELTLEVNRLVAEAIAQKTAKAGSTSTDVIPELASPVGGGATTPDASASATTANGSPTTTEQPLPQEVVSPPALKEEAGASSSLEGTPVTPMKAKKRRCPTSFSDENRAKIGKYAAEHTTAAARRHFKEDFGDIAESTVRTFKNLYEQELTRRKSTGESIDITTLPKKKRGRPVMLTSDIDENIQKYILALKQAGNPINTDVVLAAAESIIAATDKSVLIENGGKLALTRGWAVSFLQRAGLVVKKKQVVQSTNLHLTPDHAELLSEVATYIPGKWKVVGAELQVKEGELDAIEVTSDDPMRCFSAVFTLWRKKETKLPLSWWTVLQALEAPAVGEQKMARQLRSKLTKSWFI